MSNENEYPVQLILSAIRNGSEIVVIADDRLLYTQGDVETRYMMYYDLTKTTGLPYDYTVATPAELDEAVAGIREDLEGRLARGRGQAVDATTGPRANLQPMEDPLSEDRPHSTPEAGKCQEASMIVQYKGRAPEPRHTDGQGRLDAFIINGTRQDAPERSIARNRRWLLSNGFRPLYNRWRILNPGAGQNGQRRVEVWASNQPLPVAALPQEVHTAGQSGKRTEAERLEIRRAKAQAGARFFEPCPTCPLLRDCPHGYTACERKAEYAKEAQKGTAWRGTPWSLGWTY